MNWVCRGVAACCVFVVMAASVAVGADAPAAALPRPEHPMPQMQRAEWLNLNGTWEFAETDDANRHLLALR